MPNFTEESEDITFLQFILKIVQSTTIKDSFWELTLNVLYVRFQREIVMNLQLKGQVLHNWYTIIDRLQPEYFVVVNDVLKITIDQLCSNIRNKLEHLTIDPEEYMQLEKIFVDIGCIPSKRVYQSII